MPTTALCTTFKSELLRAIHNFLVTNASNTAVSGVSGAFTLTGLTSVAGIVLGMAASGPANLAAGAIVASIDSQTQVTVSKAHTGTITTSTVTFTADSFKLLLIKSLSPSGTYDGTLTNVGTPNNSTGGTPSTTNVGTDEVAASGTYAAGGIALANLSPVSTNPTTSAAVSFSGTVQWTGATLSVICAVIYNASVRGGAASGGIVAATGGSAINRAVSVHDFAGTQSVTGGTLTLTLPTQDGTTGLIRIT